MADFQDFKRDHFFGARMVSASVNKTVQKQLFPLNKKRKRFSKAQVWPKAEVVKERPSNFTSNC